MLLDGIDKLIWAIGREAHTRDLDLDKAGVSTSADGRVIVYFLTLSLLIEIGR